ncbi:hypothetical protein HY419_00540 [candidate division WWE3 bacterium]|nr:hypothetical protein [candidate division WWE3 bacterium]
MLVLQEGKQVTDLIKEAGKIAIVPSRASGMDGLCAAVGLFRTLKSSGKETALIYPFQIPYDAGDLISKSEIAEVRGSRDLVIGIDYGGTPIEKVNYQIEGSIFKLILHPVSRDFDTKRINFSTSGFNFDLIFSIGAQKLEDHEALFREYGDEIKKSMVINIDNSGRNENYGTMNVVEPENDSLSLLVLHKLTVWNYRIDKEAAKSLLTGISLKKTAPEQ